MLIILPCIFVFKVNTVSEHEIHAYGVWSYSEYISSMLLLCVHTLYNENPPYLAGF